MNDPRNDRGTGLPPSPPPGRPSRSGGLIGGALMFALLYVVDKLRPGQRRGDDAERSKQIDAEQSPAAGTIESIAGTYPAPPGVHASVSSHWPIVVAAAIAFTAFGVVTNYAFCVIGMVVLVVGIVGWAGEMIRE